MPDTPMARTTSNWKDAALSTWTRLLVTQDVLLELGARRGSVVLSQTWRRVRRLGNSRCLHVESGLEVIHYRLAGTVDN